MLNSLVLKCHLNTGQNNHLNTAAVSCSPVPYRLGAGGIGVWDDGLAGPWMASVHGVFGWVSWAVHGA